MVHFGRDAVHWRAAVSHLFCIFVFNVQDFRLHTYIEESWRDTRLRTWSMGKLKHRVLPEWVARLIWTPDVVFSNAKKSSIFRQSVESIAVKIADDGSIHRLTR